MSNLTMVKIHHYNKHIASLCILELLGPVQVKGSKPSPVTTMNESKIKTTKSQRLGGTGPIRTGHLDGRVSNLMKANLAK